MVNYEEVFDVCVWLVEKVEGKIEWKCGLYEMWRIFGDISGEDWRRIKGEMLMNGWNVMCKRGMYEGMWKEVVIVKKMEVE
ncbi:MAG: hypothetical protein PHT97_10890 [Methanoculleus sp.]|uniref:hypothetical protein n=1 Tax=Methanoculleus sp. TaxID=90427 RepID=UPI00263372E3|nr:hypothetical protein [Methanoculleus sp.]MDD4471647.1 hypothetical protein [Methanoculleus sp.]